MSAAAAAARAQAYSAAEIAQVAQLAFDHPLAYAMHASGWQRDRKTGTFRPRWMPARHLKYLGKHLMRIHKGECKRLLVSMPPRHGKTMLTSRFFLGWWLGRHPADRIITTTYQARLVQRWSRNIRNDLVRVGPEVFGVAASSRAAADDWDLLPMRARVEGEDPVEGGVSAVGTGGALTGKGAQILNADDLVRGSEDVRNPQVRDNMWDWFEQDLISRLEPDGAALVTMTRWHADDIPGRIIKTQQEGKPIGGEPWEIINLPALAEEDDALGRKPGEALWPERWPQARLERMRDGMSPYAWSALYQGRPTPAEGNLFEKRWVAYFREDGEDLVSTSALHGVRAPVRSLLKFLTVDPAFSLKTKADFTAIGVWGLDRVNNRLFLLDVIRRRMHAPDVGPAMQAAMTKYGATLAYVEKNNLKLDEMDVIRRSGVAMREIQPNTDKVARFMPVQGHASSGRLLFRAGAPWLPELEHELLVFDNGDHDDLVDMVSYGVHVANLLTRSGGLAEMPDGPPRGGPPGGLVPMLKRPT